MLRILIVEDESTIRKLIKSALKDFNATFLETDNGLAAVNLTRQHQPDLVIMDIILTNTGIDGLEATRMIKRHPQTHQTKILLSSGMVDLKSTEIDDSGADAVLPKPYTPTKLQRIVRKLTTQKSLPAGA